ncbi:MAG: glycosyltransferase [Deltaproteobacteria bacterium]|nr:glycosyltransferase [Deltaproteobacteria bacterium]
MDITINNKIRITIVSHALVSNVNQTRWKRLAEDDKYEVHLLVPKYWESHWFGKDEKIVFEPKEIHDDNFHIHPLATTSVKNWGKYLFKSFDAKFREIKPDLIYIIHEESILIHHQIYLYKKFFAPNAKVIFFSMNARGAPNRKFYHRLMWNNVKKNTDAALVHYPGCLESLRNGGYKKPVYLQTQIGVDEKLFRPDSNARAQYRKKLGFEEKFVIGYTGRLTVDKGVDDLIAIFPLDDIDWALLLVGNGDMRQEIEDQVKRYGWEDRVHITGYVAQAEVPKYMNAMDCFVLGSKTMPHWIDTFPLVTVQAQACGVPVIASDSASLLWQLADSALFFHEGDRRELKEKVLMYVHNPALKNEYAQRGRERSLRNFCHEGMTENFKKIVSQVIKGKPVYHQANEEYTQWKAF